MNSSSSGSNFIKNPGFITSTSGTTSAVDWGDTNQLSPWYVVSDPENHPEDHKDFINEVISLFTDSSKLAVYLTSEHKRNRTLADIVVNRLKEEEQKTKQE